MNKRRFNPLTALGPGLITGAADDDPSGIATYSQAGAQFGLGMLWTTVLTYPFMAVFQTACARIGRVTGRGLAANIRTVFPAWVVLAVVVLLLLANILNIAADIAAMGEAAGLVIPGGRHAATIGLAALTLGLQVFVPYHRYVWFLKWLTLSLFAYVAAAFAVKAPWMAAVRQTFLPELKINRESAAMVVAVFGTTISPYLFFWQASEEVEDISDHKGAHALSEAPEEAPSELKRIGWDTYAGMALSNIVAFFIILTTAVTLHAAGIVNVATAAQAGNALRPLAGDLAFHLFALGIIGAGLLAIPTLAGSAAYALAEALRWKASLASKFSQAHGFYAIIALAILGGILLDYSPIDPIKALIFSAIVNGVIAAPLMIVIMALASRRSLLGPFVATGWQFWGGWAATAVMALASVLMFVLMGSPA